MELTVRRKFNVSRFIPDIKFETVDFEISVEIGESKLTDTLANAYDFCEKEIEAMITFYISHIKAGNIK